MRKPYKGYEIFIKEQKPKYDKTFLEWFAENQKIGEIDLLTELQKKNVFIVNNNTYSGFYSTIYVGYFKDFFSKKLQLCFNLITLIHTEQIIQYNIDVVADVMDLYEDIIQEICIRDNIYVCNLPNGTYSNGRMFTILSYSYKNFDELKQELETGIIIVYYFKILENGLIEIRYSKREPLTRSVLFERTI